MDTLKLFLIFSQKKAVLIFQEMETPKISYIFLKESFPYISRNENLEKTLYISGSNFPNSKNKKNPLLKRFLNFRKWTFLAPNLENFLYFRNELTKPENREFLIHFLMKKQNFLN